MVGWSTLIAVCRRLPLGVLLVLTDRGGLLQNAAGEQGHRADREHRPVDAVHHPDGRADDLHPLDHRDDHRQRGGRHRAARHRRSRSSRGWSRRLSAKWTAVSSRRCSRWAAPPGPSCARSWCPSPAARHRRHHHTIVALIGYSAMAGTVGAGGLGDVAFRYGYQRFETELMWITVAILAVVISSSSPR